VPLVQLKADRLPCWFPGGGAWAPGEPREVSEEQAVELLRLDAFEHVHDEHCEHPAEEATETSEEGL
jgi:hypothetical protein